MPDASKWTWHYHQANKTLYQRNGDSWDIYQPMHRSSRSGSTFSHRGSSPTLPPQCRPASVIPHDHSPFMVKLQSYSTHRRLYSTQLPTPPPLPTQNLNHSRNGCPIQPPTKDGPPKQPSNARPTRTTGSMWPQPSHKAKAEQCVTAPTTPSLTRVQLPLCSTAMTPENRSRAGTAPLAGPPSNPLTEANWEASSGSCQLPWPFARPTTLIKVNWKWGWIAKRPSKQSPTTGHPKPKLSTLT